MRRHSRGRRAWRSRGALEHRQTVGRSATGSRLVPADDRLGLGIRWPRIEQTQPELPSGAQSIKGSKRRNSVFAKRLLIRTSSLVERVYTGEGSHDYGEAPTIWRDVISQTRELAG